MFTLVGKAGDRVAERVFEVIDPTAAPGGTPQNMRIMKNDLPTIMPDGVRSLEQIAIGGGDLYLSEVSLTVVQFL